MTTNRLFSPNSLFWQVNREALMVLSGPRALLMELAHPLVAAGVAEHSDFRRRPMRRLFRTVGVMTALNFEPGARAQAAVDHTRRCHGPVQGVLRETVGPYLAGTPYRGGDPLLQLWVLATLVDSVLVTFDHLVRRLTLAERQAYYVGALGLGRAFGIPPELMPPQYEDFHVYVDAMVSSDALTVGAQAREIVGALFAPPLLGPSIRLSSFISMGLTPPRLREAFGFRWSAGDERRFHWLGAAARRIRPFTPAPLVIHPQALLAEWRLRWARIDRAVTMEKVSSGMSRSLRIQIWILFAVLLANFAAQVPYFLHLYYSPQHPLPDPRSLLVLGSVLALFLAGFGLLVYRRRAGYYLLLFYLGLEFSFCLWNIAGGVVHGYGLFFHLADRDPILWAVNAAGYLSFLAAGYFLTLLLVKHREFQPGVYIHE